MSYEQSFKASALKEWQKLDDSIRRQFKSKLAERLKHSIVEAYRLRYLLDCYKIKLHYAGYRLVYRVDGQQVMVIVVALGRCERLAGLPGSSNTHLIVSVGAVLIRKTAPKVSARPASPPSRDQSGTLSR